MTKKSFAKTMRAWHRDIGYFVIGLTIVYAISGIVLSGRGLGWLALEYKFDKQIETNLTKDEIIEKIPSLYSKTFLQDKLPSFLLEEGSNYEEIEMYEENEEEGMVFGAEAAMFFYKAEEGKLTYDLRTYPPIIKEFNQVHMASHQSLWFYLAILYSIALLFLAFSAIFMVEGKNGFKRRGVYFMVGGFIVVAIFIYLSTIL